MADEYGSISPPDLEFPKAMRGLGTRHHPSPRRTVMDTNVATLTAELRRVQLENAHLGQEMNNVVQLLIATGVPISEVQLRFNGLLQSYYNAPRTGDVPSMAQTAAYTIDAAALEQHRSVTGFNVASNSEGPLVDVNVLPENYHHALEASNDVVRPSVHFEPSTNIISSAGDRDAAGGSGWCRNGWATAIRLFYGWGGAINPFRMSLWMEISNTLSILGIGAINVKGASLALSLIPSLVDQQPPLNTQDKIYMTIAFWCGVLAFLIVPFRVPGAESTRLARNRQVIGVTTLITGTVIFMVTAVEEKLRLLVLFLIFACILFSLYLEKRELNETQLLPQ